MERLNNLPDTINKNQLLFGINQGATFDDLRIEHMKIIAELDLDGYAIGGLAVGEPKEDMYRIISAVEPFAPKDKIRYLMGVGTPGNIIEGVSRGVDLFACVMPSRNARHGHLFTSKGIINIDLEFTDIIEVSYDLGVKNIGGGTVGAVIAYPLIKLLGASSII